MRITVLIILTSIIAVGAILMIWGLIEAAMLKVTHDKLILGDSDGSSPEGSAEGPDLRILYFSDLHREMCPISSKRVISVIRREHASGGLDAVIFGGDISEGRHHALKSLDYLNAIGDALKELGIPYMAVTGNHDTEVPPEEIGMFNFDNMDGCIRYLKSRRDARYIAFAGVKDTGRKHRVWMTPPAPSAGIPYTSYILLSHNPDHVLHLPPELSYRVDAMISGHIHGGQIRTPFGWEFVLRHDELPYKGIISGLHDINGVKLFISKGIGCVFLPFRFFARPEINILEIYADRG